MLSIRHATLFWLISGYSRDPSTSETWLCLASIRIVCIYWQLSVWINLYYIRHPMLKALPALSSHFTGNMSANIWVSPGPLMQVSMKVLFIYLQSSSAHSALACLVCDLFFIFGGKQIQLFRCCVVKTIGKWNCRQETKQFFQGGGEWSWSILVWIDGHTGKH